MKVKASWSKPDGITGLIGRKKVDWSIFEYGTPIPVEFQGDFDQANGGYSLYRGERTSLKLVIDGKVFDSVSLFNMDRTGVKANTYHIRYDGHQELRDYLKESMQDLYFFLKDNVQVSVSGKRKIYPSVPHDIAVYMDFYETGEPFRYKVKIVHTDHDRIQNKPVPVKTYDGIVQNVERFNNELPTSSVLINKLKMFKRWYYIPEIGIFGPSKYIGYRDMSQAVYQEDLQDGGVTEGVLRGWFDVLDEGSELDILLKGELNAMLRLYGKSIKQNAFIHVPKGYNGKVFDLEGQRALSALDEQELEKKVQMSESEFEKWLLSASGEASIEVRQGVKKIRRYQQSVIKRLKEKYAGKCQICGWSSLDEFGVDISEAHHIEHFSKTMNNKPSNIVIVCPTHHRLLHATHATLNREEGAFIGSKRERIPLWKNMHL